MSGSEPVPPVRDQLLEEAAAWFARMRGPGAEESREAFEAWLRRGALHRQAYNRASEIFAMGKVLAEDDAAPAPAPRAKWAEGRRSPAGLAWAIGVLIILGAAGWLAAGRLAPGGGQEQPIAEGGAALPPAQILQTSAAGPRTVRLADGSLVTLAAGSLLEVRLGPSQRRLDLRRGGGRFRVFHEVRPFVVHAGGGRVVARGTVFDVGFARDRGVTVRLIEGAVDVTYPARTAAGADDAATRRLRPGQTFSYGAAQQGPTLAPAPASGDARSGADAARAPPQPAHDFDNVALGELIAAANRGSSRPIRLVTPALADRRVSGRFRIDDTALLAERLALLFDLAIEHRPDGIALRLR